MVKTTSRSGSLVLPERIRSIQAEFPWPRIESSAKRALGLAIPTFSDEIDELPLSVFGLNSGFFYLPAALAAEWGAPISLKDFLDTLAVGHVYFAFQDAVVDEGSAPAELCMIAHEALLEYLERISAIARPDLSSETAMMHALDSHRRNYALYASAIATDLRHRATLARYTPAEIAGLGWKAAPCNTPFEVVAARSSREERTADLLEAVRFLCVGLQMMDDLSDLAVDHADGNMTMALSHTLLHLREAGLGERCSDPIDILLAAEMTGVSRASCEIAVRMFGVARALAVQVDAMTVAELCDAWIVRANERLDAATRVL